MTLQAVAIAVGLSAAAAPAPPQVAWRPNNPQQGSLVVVGVRAAAGDSFVAVTGTLAGEALMFERFGDWFEAVGGIPLTAGHRVTAELLIDRADGRRDTVAQGIAVVARRAPLSRLRLPERFVTPPASETARIRAESQQVQDVKRKAHDLPRLWHDPFQPPRPNRVSGTFGATRIYNGHATSRHLGVDFPSDSGAIVHATNDGVVALVGDFYFSGGTVFLYHGGGLVTAYLHLSKALVARGDTVKRGQPIGEVGSTGRALGPHLHWFASFGDVTVDPLDLLTLELGAPLR